MSLSMGLLVVVGAALGAPLRYLTDRAVRAHHDSAFPWGTLAVNTAGSFLLGLLVGGVSGHGTSEAAMAALGTGFCGALTTYSTFSYETVRLALDGAWGYAAANVVANLAAGLAAAACGAALFLVLAVLASQRTSVIRCMACQVRHRLRFRLAVSIWSPWARYVRKRGDQQISCLRLPEWLSHLVPGSQLQGSVGRYTRATLIPSSGGTIGLLEASPEEGSRGCT